jgi:Asp-tRNA(Asn)/Glu-tRNA(Gln) amidotransferase A subunit family amidase
VHHGRLAGAGGCARRKDAFVAQKLREAGAVIIGKTNLSEWANMRSTHSVSGWSGRGGQTRNPYALDRNTSGSSSGSGAAMAAGLATLAIGTETDGSIVSPASTCGIVGIKPTLGLVSRSGIIPIAHSQDTAGPMTRSVADAALLLGAIAGVDANDAATRDGQGKAVDYAAALRTDGLKGKRIGVARNFFGSSPAIDAVIDKELAILKAQGAILVDVQLPNVDKYGDSELEVLLAEFRPDLEAYLRELRAARAGQDHGRPDRLQREERRPRAAALRPGASGRRPEEARPRRQGLPRGAGQQPPLFARRGHRQDPEGREAGRAGRADRRHRLADRLHQRRPLRRQLLVAGGGGRLPARDGAGRLCGRPAGRDLLRRHRLDRGGADRHGLRLRAGQPAPPPAGFPATVNLKA